MASPIARTLLLLSLASAAWAAVRSDAAGATIDVSPNTGARRTTTISLGGRTVNVAQSAAGEPPMPCPATRGLVSGGLDTGRPVVAGSVVSIYGGNLAPRTEAAPAGPLPSSLAGVSVTIDGRAAPLYFVSPGQINAQAPVATNIGSVLPADLPDGEHSLIITVAGAPSAAVPVWVAKP